MKGSIQKRLRQAKRRIERRLEGAREDRGRPMLGAANLRYELAEKVRGMGCGGIGLVHQLAQEIGLADAIDRRVQVLKIHRPYHESDHVLNLAYNAICDGTRLEDIELRRNDEVFLDSLDAERIPDPATAGDFCRRFAEGDIRNLLRAADDARLNVWARQHAPVDNLYSNWTYMAATALAWNLKAWWALWLPETGREPEQRRTEKQRVLRMEFKTFLNVFIKIPCQIVRSGRKLIYRVLNFNPHLPVFFRLCMALRC